ncbi:bacteriocin maturation radical SAM protein 1 [Saccharomonospora marina XMU15]|uniref:Bacteriocin maturation radical SAM protein 1 n=1 Tax=Saccharomonospora marina XMU15 TaxID=882083 RepID=H5X7S2_9PSEU|nr:RiPP maturation radical SAM C-methyltransferase [Saccharomonospora marina]EHR51365.1 bacteriocin maturation radical SAM protein 1 [Saccharomonospora marina XMU15]
MKISLVNMPFADWDRPSLALSQLSALIRREFGDQVEVSVHSLNLDFACYFGAELYEEITGQLQHLLTGLGEWIFRGLAFPSAPENQGDYFNRYYTGPQWNAFRTQIMELRAGLPELLDRLCGSYALAESDLIGFTSMFAQTNASIAMARLVKRRNPSAVAVLGGANCEAPMGAALVRNVPEIDAVFSGPALHTFPDFVQRYLGEGLSAVNDIVGVVTPTNVGDPRFAAGVGRDRDIDDFFEPDYSEYLEAFHGVRSELSSDPEIKPELMFETSRGCWWGQRSHCTFCGLNGLGMGYRAMSPEVALRQFTWLFGLSDKARGFMCTDNIMPKKFPREVFGRLPERSNGPSIFYEVKLPLSSQDMAAMVRVGVTKVQPGIESLSTKTLKLMGKGTTAFLNIQFLKNCVRNNMNPAWNLLMGFPGECEDVYRKYVEDLPLLTHLPPPGGAYLVRFDRYSPYFTDPDKYGLELMPMDFYEKAFPFPAEHLHELAYFFADHGAAPYAELAVEWLGEVSQLVERWRSGRASTVESDRPVLEVQRREDGSRRIVDTRFGHARELLVDELMSRLLQRLAAPVTEEALTRAEGSGADVRARLELLREHDMLFEEDGRIISLVLLDVPEDGPVGDDDRVLLQVMPAGPSQA